MGRIVWIRACDAWIPHVHLQVAYEAMCALNTTHCAEKTGGSTWSWSENGVHHEPRSFAWMDEDYPQTCKNAEAVLAALGFDMHTDDATGDLVFDGYHSKAGQEALFLEAIAPWAVGWIEWQDECNREWTTEFRGPRPRFADPWRMDDLVGHIEQLQRVYNGGDPEIPWLLEKVHKNAAQLSRALAAEETHRRAHAHRFERCLAAISSKFCQKLKG